MSYNRPAEQEVVKSADQLAIERVLEYSDIVWSKYGTETIETLARKIISTLGR